MPGAILPFQRMQKRHEDAKPTDKIFGKTRNDLINQILSDCNLRFDRNGNTRTAHNLRHTHLKNTLDASAINLRKPRRRWRKPTKADE